MRVEPRFRSLLDAAQLDELEVERGTVYGVWPDGRLAYTNPAWSRFAQENGAPDLDQRWPLGRSVWEAVPQVLQQAYRAGWERALAGAHPWSQAYECSSPGEFRLFRMTTYGLGEGEGLLVLNSTLRHLERPSEPRSEVEEGTYAGAGRIEQCANCRRVRNLETGEWDWVREWIQTSPPQALFTLCEVCSALFYYGRTPGGAGGLPDLPRRP